MENLKRQIIDVHAHVIPGLDDGARDMEEACDMLERAAAQGIVAVIATPHEAGFMEEMDLVQRAEELQQEIRKRVPGFSVFAGQEAYYREELIERLQTGKVITMVNSRYILVEFQPFVSFQILCRGIRQLVLAGYTPILAHIERYRCLRQKGALSDLSRNNCLFQLNYESLEGGRFQTEVRWCRKQLRDNRIHFLGTDMHQSSFRPPDIEPAWSWLEKHVDQAQLRQITYDNPVCVIKNQKIG